MEAAEAEVVAAFARSAERRTASARSEAAVDDSTVGPCEEVRQVRAELHAAFAAGRGILAPWLASLQPRARAASAVGAASSSRGVAAAPAAKAKAVAAPAAAAAAPAAAPAAAAAAPEVEPPIDPPRARAESGQVMPLLLEDPLLLPAGPCRYYAMWRAPRSPEITGVIVAPDPQGWDRLVAKILRVSYPNSGARLKRFETFAAAAAGYAVEAERHNLPAVPLVWLV